MTPDGHDEVNTLRDKVLALEAKLDIFSHGQTPFTAQHKVLLGPKDYKRLKHGKDASFDAEIQYLKPQLYHKHSCIINS
jgi:hypothetical protein